MRRSRTIFALSSGRGRAGIAVVRISGPAAGAVLDSMAAPRPRPRYAALRRIRHPTSRELLDEGLVLWFPAPGSETGEDIVELHLHGGPAVLRAVLQALATIDGLRLAEPGEFARRAFENGKLDLTAVEGLADLIEAETESQRRLALAQAGGQLARLYDGWRGEALQALALVEAAIDFSDEADVSDAAIADGRRIADQLAQKIDAHLADKNRGEIIRDGFRVVLAGPPNVGKSSLLNALARREAAIVSPEAGTTRDVIEVRLDIGGAMVVLADTAGLREAEGPVEKEGIRRTLERARGADLVLWVVDLTCPNWQPPADLQSSGAPVLIVANKSDLAGTACCGRDPCDAITVSAATGRGLSELSRRIATELTARLDGDDVPLLTQARHRQALKDALAALRRCVGEPAEPTELRAEDLRIAAHALGRVTGRIDVEDVLDQIFARFCIGK